MSETQQSDDGWTVIDHDNDANAKTFDSRSAAEDAAETAREFGSNDVEVRAPGEDSSEEAEPDGGEAAVVDDAPDTDHEPEVLSPEEVEQAAADLPDRNVGQDPLKWMPGEFVDEIDGSMAINRKGFEVLAHFYDVSVTTELEVAPEETDHEYARVKATAKIDGRTVEAYGSAHVDRGDDHYLLLEMAGTRARKRALSIATGAGAVAVEELRNESEGQR